MAGADVRVPEKKGLQDTVVIGLGDALTGDVLVEHGRRSTENQVGGSVKSEVPLVWFRSCRIVMSGSA
jgi:hypothetical protein